MLFTKRNAANKSAIIMFRRNSMINTNQQIETS